MFGEVFNLITGILTNRTQLTILIFIIAGYIYLFFLRLRYRFKIKDLKEIDILVMSLMFSLLTFLVSLPFVTVFYINQDLTNDIIQGMINLSTLFQYAFILLLYNSVVLKSKKLRNKLYETILFKISRSKSIEKIAAISFIISILFMVSNFYNKLYPFIYSYNLSYLVGILVFWPISFFFFKITIKITETIFNI